MSTYILYDPLLAAATFAATRHTGQFRGDGRTPYINHPLSVADILANEGGISDREVLVGAILHDVVEDTDATVEDIHTLFGSPTAAIVAEVTDDTKLRRTERRRQQLERVNTMSKGARLIKLADKIANLRDLKNQPPVHWTTEDRHAYCRFAKSIVGALTGTHPVLETVFHELWEDHASPADSVQQTGQELVDAH